MPHVLDFPTRRRAFRPPAWARRRGRLGLASAVSYRAGMSEERAPPARAAVRHVSAALLIACGLSWCFFGFASFAIALHIWQNLGSGARGMNGCFGVLAVVVVVVTIGAAAATGIVGTVALGLGILLVGAGVAHFRHPARPAALACAVYGLLASLALFGALVWPGAGLRIPADPKTVALASAAQVAAHVACVLAAFAAKAPRPTDV